MKIYSTSVKVFLGLSIFSIGLFAQTNRKVNNAKSFRMPEGITSEDFMANTIILKVKPEYRNLCSNNNIHDMQMDIMMGNLQVTELYTKFPNHKAPERKLNDQGLPYADISLVYELKFKAGMSVEKAINHLLSLGLFEYVEPHYIPHTTVTTNDPKAINNTTTGQYHIFKIKAAGTTTSGWDIETGATSTKIIGITDTGTEYTHEDLGQIAYNNADPIDGIDNDNDGYVDNYRGWDVGTATATTNGDNDATWEGNAHGVHVCGISAATTNNSKGGAGVAYNMKYLPVKIANTAGTLVSAYEGITYAADHGATVINC